MDWREEENGGEEEDAELIQFYSSIYTNREGETNRTDGTGMKVYFRTRPSETDFQWFHKKGNRKYAEHLLKPQPPGTFLLRPSSFPDCYAISFVAPDRSVQHDIIYALHPGFSLEKPGTSSSKNIHPTLAECVAAQPHLKTPLPDHQANAELSTNSLESSFKEIVNNIKKKLTTNNPACVSLSWVLISEDEEDRMLTRSGIVGSILPHRITGLLSSPQLPSSHSSSSSSSLADSGSVPAQRTIVNYCNIEYLAPDLLPLSGPSIQKLSDALIVNKSLVQLTIKGHTGRMFRNFTPNLIDADVMHLARALKTNRTLRVLNISTNIIGDKGAAALAAALLHNRTLVKIDLSCNFITDKGLLHLAKAVNANYPLKEMKLRSQLCLNQFKQVALSHDQISLRIVQQIENALKRKQELRERPYFKKFLTPSQAESYLLSPSSPSHPPRSPSSSLSLSSSSSSSSSSQPLSFILYLDPRRANVLIHCSKKRSDHSHSSSSSLESRVSGMSLSGDESQGAEKVVICHRPIFRQSMGYSFKSQISETQRATPPTLVECCIWVILSNWENYSDQIGPLLERKPALRAQITLMEKLHHLWCLPKTIPTSHTPLSSEIHPTLEDLLQYTRF